MIVAHPDMHHPFTPDEHDTPGRCVVCEDVRRADAGRLERGGLLARLLGESPRWSTVEGYRDEVSSLIGRELSTSEARFVESCFHAGMHFGRPALAIRKHRRGVDGEP